MYKTLDRCIDANPATEYVVRVCTVRGYRYKACANAGTAALIANWHRHAIILTPNWSRSVWRSTRVPGFDPRPTRCPV